LIDELENRPLKGTIGNKGRINAVGEE